MAQHAPKSKAPAPLLLACSRSLLRSPAAQLPACSPCCLSRPQDSATAKKLAFAREINTRCITLEGDDFNPGGTLTGGSRNNSGRLLARLHELAEAEGQLAQAQAALAQAQGAIQATAAAAAQYKKWAGALQAGFGGAGCLK